MSENTRATLKGIIVTVIIIILALFILPVVLVPSCQSKESTANAIVNELNKALEEYNSFYGSYPPTDIEGDLCACPEHGDKIVPSSHNLVKYLSRLGPRNIPFYDFKPRDLLYKDGEYSDIKSPIREGDILCYRENASVPDTKKTKAHNKYKYDIYAPDCDGVYGGHVKNW